MTDWQRMEQVIRWTGLSTNAFATAVGLRRAENLYQIKRGNNRISKDLAELVVRRYPAVNKAWLLAGGGPMFALTAGTDGGGDAVTAAAGIPYYHVDAVSLVCSDGAWGEPQGRMAVPGMGECDFAALCAGTALEPEVPAGAVVALKAVAPQDPLMPGQIYLAVTPEFAMMRYLKLDRKLPDGIWLVPAEGAQEEPVGVRRERIEALYLVKGIVVHKVL